jgi:hypothetical protein
MIKVNKLNENDGNFLSALVGMGLAFNKTVEGLNKGINIFFGPNGEYNALYFQMLDRAKRMAFKGMGHNKFLRAMNVDLIVQAPCDWWQQQATYTTIAAVQSTSTMHMLKKAGLGNGIDPLVDEVILNRYNELLKETDDLIKLKRNLPSGYMYIRTIHLNYMNLQHMVSQRINHKEPEWPSFCEQVMDQVNHPYFVMKELM